MKRIYRRLLSLLVVLAMAGVVTGAPPEAHAFDLTSGTISLDVAKWEVDGAGLTTYDLTFSGSSLRAGPCASGCDLGIWTTHRTMSGDTWTNFYHQTYSAIDDLNVPLSASAASMGEVTHVRAKLANNDGSIVWRREVAVDGTRPPVDLTSGTIALDVAKWDVDGAGLTTYDLTVTGSALRAGPCASGCDLGVWTTYRTASGDTWTNFYHQTYSAIDDLNVPLSASAASMGEVTHVRAKLANNDGSIVWRREVPVAGTVPGTFDLTVNDYVLDPSTGQSSWDLRLTGERLDWSLSPCPKSCQWRVDAVDRSSGAEVHRYTAVYGDYFYGGGSSLNHRYVDSRGGFEVTHLVARLEGNGISWVREVAVAGTAPAGTFNFEVNRFVMDASSGRSDWDVRLTGEGLGSSLSPCPKSCQWRVDAVDRSSGAEVHRYTAVYGDYFYGGGWALNHCYVGNNHSGGVTHLVARLEGNGLTWTREVPVSGLTVLDFDLSDGGDTRYAAGMAVAASAATCDRLLSVPGPSTNANSLPDHYEACLATTSAGSLTVQALAAKMAYDFGPDIGELLIEWAKEDLFPDSDPRKVVSVPWWSPTDAQRPPAPPVGPIPPWVTCLSPADAQAILADSNVETHHVATIYGQWAVLMSDAVAKFGLGLEEDWNKLRILHKGPHPREYHQWVLANMRQIASEATTAEEFKLLYQQRVVEVVREDPTIVRRAYWVCHR